MRELDECTAEVFRRGEQRIKERRRKRGRVLAVCIPVCLIAAVWSAGVFPPAMLETEGNDRAQAAEGALGSAPESAACPYTAVEIQAAGMRPAEHDGKVTDRLAVAEMFQTVQSLFADADGKFQDVSENRPAGEACPTDQANMGDAQTEFASTWKGCTITFTAEDGSRGVYRLSGGALVNAATGETVFLSDSQAAGLMAVLGLSE